MCEVIHTHIHRERSNERMDYVRMNFIRNVSKLCKGKNANLLKDP